MKFYEIYGGIGIASFGKLSVVKTWPNFEHLEIMWDSRWAENRIAFER